MDSDYSELKEAQKSCLEDQQVQQIEELYQERTNLEKANSSLVNQVHRHAPDIGQGYMNDFISCLGKDLIPICKKKFLSRKAFWTKDSPS